MKSLKDRGDLDEILSRIRAIRPDSARQWGRMTPNQMVCHVTDSFGACLGDTKFPAFGGPLRRAVMKWIALYTGFPWPKSLPTGAKVDPLREGTGPGDLAEDIAALERMCHRFVLSKERNARHIHPLFGPLSDSEWGRWGYLHTDHHLRQFGL